MSGKTENFHRNATDGSNKTDFDYFITSDLPLDHIVEMLKLQKMGDKEIDETIQKITDSRTKIRKVVKKFLAKINASYGHLDIPELMNKGMKHAAKYGLDKAQQEVFRKHVMKGDTHNHYSYMNELKYSGMAKFLGFDNVGYGQMVKLNPKDFSKLNELHMLYDNTKQLHADVKTHMYSYRSCAPEAIYGTYIRERHNVAVCIHPVVAALFLPKIKFIEDAMLKTNIARMVLTRARAYLQDYNIHLTNLGPDELEVEAELAYNIAHDPNALSHFKDETPITNMIKRYKCQIELYHNVMNLRQGRYYSTGYDANDGIAGFTRVLNSYDWTFFDSPDLYHVYDEGTVLRKLLAVFSIRPTFTQLTSFSQRYGMGYTNISGLSRTVFVNIPIINVKLPVGLPGAESNVTSITLSQSTTQTDLFVEHKSIVPKNKTVIHSRYVAFFYANRRYNTVNFTGINQNMRYLHLPMPLMNMTSINTTLIDYEVPLRIGKDFFNLRSVVLLQRSPLKDVEVSTGCSAAIDVDNDIFTGGEGTYIHYNPTVAAIALEDNTVAPNANQYTPNPPITFIHEVSNSPDRIGFRTESQARGTIFIYENANA